MSRIIHALGCVVVTVVLGSAFGCVGHVVEESESAGPEPVEPGESAKSCDQLMQDIPAASGGNALQCDCGLTGAGEERGMSLCVTFDCAADPDKAKSLCQAYCGCRTEIETPQLHVTCGGPDLQLCP